MVNSLIYYNIQNNKTLISRVFRKKVIAGLLEGFSLKKVRRHRGTGTLTNRLEARHFPSQFDDKKVKPNCVVCSILPGKSSKKGKGDCK